MTENTDIHLLVADTFKKGRGVDHKTSQYLVWPPFASCSVTHLLRIQLIRLLIVACGNLWNVVPLLFNGCVKLLGTGTPCVTRWSRASQTCSMGDISYGYTGHGRTETFSASRNGVQILVTCGCALCWNMRWWQPINGTTMGLRIVTSVHSNGHR